MGLEWKQNAYRIPFPIASYIVQSIGRPHVLKVIVYISQVQKFKYCPTNYKSLHNGLQEILYNSGNISPDMQKNG